MDSAPNTEKEFFHVAYGHGTDADEVSLDIANNMADEWIQAQEVNVENVAKFVRSNLNENQLTELVKSLTKETKMTNLISLTEAIANHHAIIITFHLPDPDQDHGTAWIETLVPVELPHFKHVLINEDNVFNHPFEVEDGKNYSIDTLPRELVMEAIEDFPELVTAYETRIGN